MYQKNVCFAINGSLKMLVINLNHTFAVDVWCMMYDVWCHDVLMTAYEFKNIVILNVKGVDYRCIL